MKGGTGGVEMQRVVTDMVPSFDGDDDRTKVMVVTDDEQKMDWIYRPRGTPRSFQCGSGNIFRANVNPCVFLFATLMIWVVIIWGAVDTDGFKGEFFKMQSDITAYWSWLYIGGLNLFMMFCFFCVFSKYGDIVLAPADSPEPQFNYYSWFSMLFSAGVGIGLFFFGVSEPMWFYATLTRENVNYIRTSIPTPDGEGTRPLNVNDWANPGSVFTPDSRYERALSGMNIAWFDWGLSASSCYVVFGLPLAFYHYRYGMPLTVRSAFYPMIGNRIYGWFGDLVDAFCIIGTVFGVCTSLGLGVAQMVTGMTVYNDEIENTYNNQVYTIIGITAVATMSVATGLDVGIRRLSEVNFTLGIALLFIVFYMGSPEYYCDFFVQMVGYHVQQLPHTSTSGGALERHRPMHPETAMNYKTTWQSYKPGTGSFEDSWTIFYWGWWISWSPFVGAFLARISKGRTVREFVVGNMIVPTLLTSIWFIIFGGSGFWMQFEAENLKLDCCYAAPTTTKTCLPQMDNKYGVPFPYADSYQSCNDVFKFDKSLKTCYKEATDVPGNMGMTGPAAYTWEQPACFEPTTNKTTALDDVSCREQFVRYVNERAKFQFERELDVCIGPYDPCNEDKFTNVACRIGAKQPQNTAPASTDKDTDRPWPFPKGGRTMSSFYSDQKMLYDVLDFFYLRDFTIVLALAGLFTYFITSSDSASQVCDMISSNGELEPPLWQRVWWAFTEGLLAIILITVGKKDDGGVSDDALKAIRAASIVAGFPLCWIMLFLVFSTLKAFKTEMAIIEGTPLPSEKRFNIRFVDAVVQLYGKCCCGIGALWLTQKPDPMECARACVSYWLPCLSIWRVTSQTVQGMISKVAWAIAIFVPYILVIVFLGLCPDYLQSVNTAEMNAKGESVIPEDSCKNEGYVALMATTWFICTMVAIAFRVRLRERHGISGSVFTDCFIFFIFPGVGAYQALQQWRSGVPSDPAMNDWQDDKTKADAPASSDNAAVGSI